MTALGSISGKAEREHRLLSKLNEAVIALEADALGKSREFSLTPEGVQRSREALREFVELLLTELNSNSASADFQSLAFRIRTGMKPVQDWIDDLSKLSEQLGSGNQVKLQELPILEDVLSLLDDEFADDLRRLYER